MLYLIRHGKTDWNAAYKLQGRTDIPLNRDGRLMAQKAAAECSNIDFDICYSSPLIRAKETAGILLNGRDIPIICDDRLMEMGFGEYEGMERCFENSDCNVNVLFQKPEQYKADKGAESMEELFARTKAFLEELVYPDLESGKNVLIVGHGAMNCSIISQIRGYDLSGFWDGMTDNCELICLVGDQMNNKMIKR